MLSMRQAGIVAFIDRLGGDRFRVDVETLVDCPISESDQQLVSVSGWVACEIANAMSDGAALHAKDLLVHFVVPRPSPIQPSIYDWTRTASVERIDLALQVAHMMMRQRWSSVMRVAGELMHRDTLDWSDIQRLAFEP
jgi:hypothetical protein